ncbi:MAG: hypothetical protein CMJ18_20380 [Phycisphaeraceae bacterium]|nr:hypothetical protein [Phycisphaeraceae bacterium]
MRKNVLADRIDAGETVLGLGVMYGSAGVIEGMCRGWDWVWIDGQHGQIDCRTALDQVRAAEIVGVEAVVRVPGHESGILGPFADLCPSGIMVPMVNSAEAAQAAVKSLRFPPLGERSYGGRRVIDLDGRDYYRERRLVVMAQIETLEAVDRAEEIAAVEGVDVLFFGPDDMKVRMEVPINTPPLEHPRLRAAMQATAEAALKAGKAAGTVTPSPEGLKTAMQMGYRVLVGGGDIVFMRTRAAEQLEVLRAVVAGSDAGPASGGGTTGIYGG